MISKQNRNDTITGKLLFATEGKFLKDGREIMLVYGKVAVPTNSGIKSGFLHAIAGLGKTLNKVPIVSCFINTKFVEAIRVRIPEKLFSAFKSNLWEF